MSPQCPAQSCRCVRPCVYAHTSTHVLVNQHIVKCLCMQSEGTRPPPPHHHISTQIYLPPPSGASTLKSFSSGRQTFTLAAAFVVGASAFSRSDISLPTQTYIQTVFSMPPNVKRHNGTLFRRTVVVVYQCTCWNYCLSYNNFSCFCRRSKFVGMRVAN